MVADRKMDATAKAIRFHLCAVNSTITRNLRPVVETAISNNDHAFTIKAKRQPPRRMAGRVNGASQPGKISSSYTNTLVATKKTSGNVATKPTIAVILWIFVKVLPLISLLSWAAQRPSELESQCIQL